MACHVKILVSALEHPVSCDDTYGVVVNLQYNIAYPSK